MKDLMISCLGSKEGTLLACRQIKKKTQKYWNAEWDKLGIWACWYRNLKLFAMKIIQTKENGCHEQYIERQHCSSYEIKILRRIIK